MPEPESSPSLFILTGTIDALDLEARSLLVGAHVVEALPFVALEPLRLGDHVVINAIRDPHTGREIAIDIHSAHLARRLPAESRDAVDRTRTVQILGLVVSLVLELREAVQVLGCELLPTNEYTVRLAIQGEVGKAVFVPRSVLEQALQDPTARRTVRNLLHTALEIMRSQRTISDIHATLAATPRTDDSWTVLRCGRCHGPLLTDDTLMVTDGLQIHVTCPQTGS